MHTTENEQMFSAIRMFLTKENLPTSDSYVYSLLKYPVSQIIAAVASFEESAVLVPAITRDLTKKLNHQLVVIFDSLLDQFTTPPPPLSSEELKKLHTILQKYT